MVKNCHLKQYFVIYTFNGNFVHLPCNRIPKCFQKLTLVAICPLNADLCSDLVSDFCLEANLTLDLLRRFLAEKFVQHTFNKVKVLYMIW